MTTTCTITLTEKQLQAVMHALRSEADAADYAANEDESDVANRDYRDQLNAAYGILLDTPRTPWHETPFVVEQMSRKLIHDTLVSHIALKMECDEKYIDVPMEALTDEFCRRYAKELGEMQADIIGEGMSEDAAAEYEHTLNLRFATELGLLDDNYSLLGLPIEDICDADDEDDE